jgi:hypothetical protein
MAWATSNNIPYFGSEIDEDLATSFNDLHIGRQPTEETTACRGVKQFRKHVLEFLAGIGLEEVGQGQEESGEDEQDADGEDDDLIEPEEEGGEDDEVLSEEESDSASPRRSRVSSHRFSHVLTAFPTTSVRTASTQEQGQGED